MNVEESRMCEHLKEVRNKLKMKQGDFAKEIKTTQGHVSDIENKRKCVSDRVTEIICLKYNVNEHWFRTGEGEMFRQLSDEIGYYVEDLLEYEGHGNAFYDLIIEMIKKYQELDEKSKTVMRNYFDSVVKAIKKEGS